MREKQNHKDQACRIVLVEKTDRLYRNIKDWVTLDDLDLEIHLVKENVILSEDARSSDKFMHGIRVLMAKNYIDNLSEEVKKGKNEKAEQGIYPSTAPIGYQNVKRDDKRVIEPDPVTGPIVRRLFQWYVTGNYSLEEITQKAYEEGLRYKKSKNKIHKGSIHRLLKNPIYYGDFIFNGTQYHGTHEPLISKDLFDRVQDMLYEKSQRRSRKQQYDWAFQGMLTCGHCGCALTAEIKKQRYVYYHCTGNRGKCPEKYVREEEIARQFSEALGAIQLDEDVLEGVVKALKESHQDEQAYHNEQIALLQRQYTTLQNRLKEMYIDKLDRRITQEFYDQQSMEWRSEQGKILEKIEQHQNADRSYMDEGIKLLELSQKAVKLYDKQPMREKRKILRFVCSNSVWKDGRLFPGYRQPFEILAVTNREY